jgi:hypothetical protein
MNRILQCSSVLLLLVGAGYGGDQQTNPPGQPPANTPAKPVVPAKKNGGVPKQDPIPKGGARAVNPANVAARLFRMTPEEREHQLEKLPNELRRQQVRRELEWFDSLPKEAQQIQLQRLDHIAQLTPEQRAVVQGAIVELNNLPPQRGNPVRQELYQLQKMNDQQRVATLKSSLFQGRFTIEELRLINVLADAWMGPEQ